MGTRGVCGQGWIGQPCAAAAGHWAQKVMHPSAGLTREYIATVESAASRKQLQTLAEGCTVDGVFVQASDLGSALLLCAVCMHHLGVQCFTSAAK